jgi:uncharacterized protein involved in exopolysaccharide biosynthesis
MGVNNNQGNSISDAPPQVNISEQQRDALERSRDEQELDVLNIFVVLSRYWNSLLLYPIAIGVIAVAATFLVSPTFKATTVILPPQQQSGMLASLMQIGGLAGIAAGASGLKNPADQFVAIIQSRSIADKLLDRFELLTVYNKNLRQEARKDLDSNTKVTAGRDGLIAIDVYDKSPDRAAQIANAYVEEFRKLLDHLAVTEAKRRRQFFEEQLAQTNAKLLAAQQSLQAKGVSASTLNMMPQSALEGVARLRAQVVAQELRLSSMRGYLAETSPDLKQAVAETSALRQKLYDAENKGLGNNGSENDYITKYREFKYQETLFELFARQFEMAKADEAREGAMVQIVDPAITPEKKWYPMRGLIGLISAVLAFIGLCVFYLARNAWAMTAIAPDSAHKIAAIKAAVKRRSKGTET